jgi:hypothetical protein
MKYQKAIDIWSLTSVQRKAIKPGQWVIAGTAKGQYMGQKSPSATDVVVWHHTDIKGYASKRSTLRAYALGQRGLA